MSAWVSARAFTDGSALVMAGAAALGAWVARPVVGGGPVAVVGAVGLALAGALRRPWLFVVAIAVVSSGFAARATAGLAIEAGVWEGTVTVLHVTTTSRGEVRAEVRGGGRHLELAPGPGQSGRVAAADPGDRLRVAGKITPIEPGASRARGVHVAGRLRPLRIASAGPPAVPWRVAGMVRDAVASLGRPLADSQRALFEGFVLGDASGQTAVQRADFRASGLTHLLVASGENVAFVLLLAAPLTGRLGTGARWVAIVSLCALYALVTGLEPSVLRAATMAVVATTASGVGRPVRSWRSLGYAVTVLVVADPFLVHSAAFGLSVGASVGILALARPLSSVLGGPRWIRAALAVTIAAQVGVAPILLGFPGGLPVAALPANLLAAVPAGMVMVVGLPALAIVATGLPGSGVFIWIPRLLLGWVDEVASRTASWSLGYLGATGLVVALLGMAFALTVGRDRPVRLRRLGWVVAALAIVVPMRAGVRAGPTATDGAGPVVVVRGRTVVVVLTGVVPDESLLTDLSVAGVRHVDAVVVPRGDRADRRMLDVVAHRYRFGRVVTPQPMMSAVADRRIQSVVGPGDVVVIGDAAVEVLATTPVLTVHVARRPADDTG